MSGWVLDWLKGKHRDPVEQLVKETDRSVGEVDFAIKQVQAERENLKRTIRKDRADVARSLSRAIERPAP